MATPLEAERPLYFGEGGELFGLYHAPGGRAGKAVLLCAPLGQEQIRCHRIYRQLAHALAAEGMAVLRFDYYGCGDSAGASAEVDWLRCIADTQAAAAELRRRSSVAQVVAFGARLGGSIALEAASPAHFAGLVLWDPVLDGDAYIARLDALQDELRVDPKRFGAPRPPAAAAGQWTGFAVSDRLRRQLAGLRPAPVPVPALLLDSLGPAAPRPWDRLGLGAERVRTLSATPWDDLARLEQAILSRPLIQAVANHLREPA
ncbi:alpha/beta fold hydrolase [Frateuria sp. Soil773]|uniref:alpha/beta fold hydrolase n=1 Tax=Frateuria sp. Soil773 TaxID=1736407 RepID=UPI00138F247C|nr:alpha/beta fold hydrolase [Frateuria sp. Soil773]